MLTNYDIEKISEKLDLPLIGVFMRDELPKERKIGSYIINMDSSEGDGTHWVFAKIFCDSDRFDTDSDSDDSVEINKYCGCLYFDSFGCGMPLEVEEFLKPFSRQWYNSIT
jgi:putative N-acetylmannosamine-6-phosphate epimerase